ncbi:MAG: hypothetical protein GQ547_08165 [Methylophaga sp.]|nr:hypothetical protein [Methylophaga sp.]
MMKEQPLFIDFEASSLNMASYPIEVAWSMEDGSIESHLINPYAIDSWTDWEPDSQAIHGLSRKLLLKQGKQPKWLAQRMNEVLSGKVMLSNGYEFDLDWCETLFKAGDEEMQFKLGDTWHVFGRKINTTLFVDGKKPEDRASAIYKVLTDISEQAWKQVEGKQHRAGTDVQQLIEMWKIVNK